tara:strand:+ start:8188 stop:8400 length:213 start_codon:yes stop_codon:yes gene_type:complete
MERTRVSSSNIRSIGYDAQNEVLEVEFVNGGIYQYFGVPKNIYERLMAASSKGRFLSTHIRDRYRTRKIR